MGICRSRSKDTTTAASGTQSLKMRDSKDMLRYGDIDIRGIENILRPFLISDEGFPLLMDILLDNMKKGLGKATNDAAKVKMIPSYVRDVPDGTERGDYLVLDFGCTNSRILLVRLRGGEMEVDSETLGMSQKIMLGSGVQLFDYFAESIADFVIQHKLGDHYIPLGFTFAFPCVQTGLDVAVLTAWTKGFKCASVVGQDVVKMLNDAIERRGDLNVKCIAVANDTVGTLMSGAHADPLCGIGLMLDSGCNAAYMERLEAVQCWNGDQGHPRQVIINMEWGAFGDDGCLDPFRTTVDKAVNKHSLNPGKQIFEKMFSGIYMGEIVRLILEKLIESNFLFHGVDAQELTIRGRFYTKYICKIEGDMDDEFIHTREVLDSLDIKNYANEDCRVVRYVCSVISRRCAHLVAAGCATLINHMNRPTVTIGIDGSLYRSHPRIHQLIMEKVRELIKTSLKFDIIQAQDGRGMGAALITAVANKSTVNT